MVQRCVIIQKDEKGYGLTVSGDNPVFVQSVKEGEISYNHIAHLFNKYICNIFCEHILVSCYKYLKNLAILYIDFFRIGNQYKIF